MITSVSNRQVKNIIQLNKKAKERNKQNVFVAEGLKMFLEAPKDRINKVYISESFCQKENYQEILKGMEYELVEDTVFRSISDTQTPQGILCLIRQYQYCIEEIISIGIPHLLLIENLQDPGNLGTIIRTGEGAGVTGVIMSKATVDIYNPKTIRSTMGSIYRMPFCYTEDLNAVLDLLREKEITSYAAHLKGNHFYDKEDYKKAAAFFIGNEGNGLTDEFAKKADRYVKIPMEGKVESLNAAIAAAILMYEVYRQRR